MKRILILVTLTLLVSSSLAWVELQEEADNLTVEFAKFAATYKKEYSTYQEYILREKIFRQNFVKMGNMFRQYAGEQEFEYSEFMDLKEEEFNQRLGFNYSENSAEESRSKSQPLKFRVNMDQEVPESFDWRDHGAVTDVKNQGSCGSCWAFSSTGNLEGQSKIVKDNLQSVSEQELVDCDKVAQGCQGGLMENAFEQLEKLGGIESESDYPYTGRGGKCSFDKSKVILEVTGYSFVDTDEEVIKETLFKTGPLAIALNATPLQFYFGGIFHPWKIFCNPKGLNHGVLLVGYGEEKGKKFWIVKNSWGKMWGEKGYFRIFRGDGTCGLNTHVVTANIK